MKRELNKWQIGLKIAKTPPWSLGFKPYFRFYLLKLTEFPPEGEALSKKYYKGIFIDWAFPIDRIIFTQKTFTIPNNKFTRWLRRRGMIRHQVYRIVYPSGLI